MRNWLNRLKKKNKVKQQPQPRLSKEFMDWGYEILLEDLTEACNPKRYCIENREDGYVILWKNNDGEWEERYTDYFDAKEPGHFTSKAKAEEAVKKIADDALNHLKQVIEHYDAQ